MPTDGKVRASFLILILIGHRENFNLLFFAGPAIESIGKTANWLLKLQLATNSLSLYRILLLIVLEKFNVSA